MTTYIAYRQSRVSAEALEHSQSAIVGLVAAGHTYLKVSKLCGAHFAS